MNHRIVRLKDVQRMTGLSRSTIYAQIAKGNFPKQIKLTGARSVGWHEHAVIQWIDGGAQMTQLPATVLVVGHDRS